MKQEGFRARAACREGESWRRRSVRCQWRTVGPELSLVDLDLDLEVEVEAEVDVVVGFLDLGGIVENWNEVADCCLPMQRETRGRLRREKLQYALLPRLLVIEAIVVGEVPRSNDDAAARMVRCFRMTYVSLVPKYGLACLL